MTTETLKTEQAPKAITAVTFGELSTSPAGLYVRVFSHGQLDATLMQYGAAGEWHLLMSPLGYVPLGSDMLGTAKRITKGVYLGREIGQHCDKREETP